MTSSRTGLTPHLRFRAAVLRRDHQAGITNCPLCDVEMDYDVSRKPESAEPDHIIPIVKGGTNTADNGRAICRRCNQSRGANVRSTTTTKRDRPRPSPGW